MKVLQTQIFYFLFKPCLYLKASVKFQITLLIWLGITIDSKLNLRDHVDNIIQKVHYKLYALGRLRKFLTFEKAKILATSLIERQFTHCPLI